MLGLSGSIDPAFNHLLRYDVARFCASMDCKTRERSLIRLETEGAHEHTNSSQQPKAFPSGLAPPTECKSLSRVLQYCNPVADRRLVRSMESLNHDWLVTQGVRPADATTHDEHTLLRVTEHSQQQRQIMSDDNRPASHRITSLYCKVYR
jgi:hypothetical protein